MENQTNTAERASSGLLGPGDPDPVAVENSGGASPFLLLGDHAGRTIPAGLGELGLRSRDRRRHIACDFGVLGLGLALARRLDATFIHQRYSRLVVDCNRAPGTPASVAAESDGTSILANQRLDAAGRRQRVEEVFAPYHQRIASELDRRLAQGRRTIVVSLHSFTPVLDGAHRPWRFGVLHGHDSPFSLAVLARLRAITRGDVGDNQPYALNPVDHTVPLHAQKRGLDYLELEVRQDLIRPRRAQVRMARKLAAVLNAALADCPAGLGSGAPGPAPGA